MPYKLDTDAQVFFYEQEFYVLSNFSAFAIEFLDILFPTVEHAYHWGKFVRAENEDLRTAIRTAKSAHEAFKLARANAESVRVDWLSVRVDWMKELIWLKVSQHEYVKKKLLETGARELIEDSWRDDFWGWGPNRDGRNMLGICWMEIRDRVRHVDAQLAATNALVDPSGAS